MLRFGVCVQGLIPNVPTDLYLFMDRPDNKEIKTSALEAWFSRGQGGLQVEAVIKKFFAPAFRRELTVQFFIVVSMEASFKSSA